MSVYIEYVIIDNFVITFLIASISFRLLKVSIKKKRALSVSLIGTLVSVFYPYMDFKPIFLILIKLALYIILCLILFYKSGYFFKASLVFFLSTAALGGAMFMAGYFIYLDPVKALTLPFYNFPIGIVLIISILLYIIIKKLIAYVIIHQGKQDFLFDIKLSVFNKSIDITAFLDSGNFLFDDIYGLPVVVLSSSIVLKILSENQLRSLLINKGEVIDKSAHYIKFDTISKEGKLLLIKAQKFQLYLKDGTNILKEVMLGLTLSRLSGGFDALLPASIF